MKQIQRAVERNKGTNQTGPVRNRRTKRIYNRAARLFLAAGCLLISSGEALRIHAGVIRVSANQTNNVPDGSSWATAFPLVQQGITAASTDDAVWVAAGTYFENITLSNNAALYGGFAPTVLLMGRILMVMK